MPEFILTALTTYAVVTGANKGIGYGICKKLASRGIVVVITARNEEMGLEALERLKKEIGFSHHLVVFHQLDVDDPASVATLTVFIKTQFGKLHILVNNAAVTGGKLLDSDAFLRKNISNEWARTMLSDIENLTREKIDEVLKEFQKDYKEGSLEIKGWPTFVSAYTMSKAALNAYTRMMAKKYPHFHINSVCPGFVKTDMTHNTGSLSID